MSWERVPLASVSDVFNGKTPSKGEQRDVGHPVLKIKDVDESGSFKGSFESFVDQGLAEKFSNKRLKLDDSLILNAAHNADYVGSKQYRAEPAVVGSLPTGEWLITRAKTKKLHPRFLNYWLRSPHARFQIKQLVKGIHLYPKDVMRMEIPLPPVVEQQRIAAILDKADAIRRKRQQAIQLADDFLRAVFLDMFGDVIDGAENIVRFSDVAVLDAPMVDPRLDEYMDLIHIGPDRIEKKNGKLLPALTAREEGLISKKFLFDDRYVLYSKIRPYLRKCAMVEEVGLCSADVYPVRPVEGVATKEFLWMLLLSDFFTAYTESLPARANIPKLNREELEAFTFSLPDYSQQLKFSSIVRATNIASQRVVKSATYAGSAFESLSQKAFSGQL